MLNDAIVPLSSITMRLARQQAPARLLRPETHRAKRRAHNASGKSDRRNRRHPDDAGKRCRDMRARCPIGHSQSGDGRKQPGAKSSENAGRSHAPGRQRVTSSGREARFLRLVRLFCLKDALHGLHCAGRLPSAPQDKKCSQRTVVT
jgi:hypothetical protein